MSVIKDDKVILYGGTTSSEEQIQNKNLKLLNDLYIFNFKQRLWEEPIVGGNYPSPKINSAFSCNYPQMMNNSGELLLVGGAEDLNIKSCFVEMKMYLLAQTEGQNWKIDRNEKFNTELSVGDDDDESMSQQPQINTVHLTDKEILEEEYGKSEGTIQKLKQDVSEMEINLKQEKLKNLRMKENLVLNTEKTKQMNQEMEKYNELRNQEITELTLRKNCNLVIISNLLESLALRIKQRKIIQARILALEQGMSAAEDFIVHLDKFFSDAIQQMCLDSVVKVTVFNEIVKKKEEHTQTLTKLRNSYEEITKAEIKVQRTQDKILSKLKSLDIDSYVAQKLTEKQTSLLKSFNLIK